jgi:hypothetical protein
MFLTILVINLLVLRLMSIHHLCIFLSVAIITACIVIGLAHYGVKFFVIFNPKGISLMLSPLHIFILSCPIRLLIIFALSLMELSVAILQAYVFMLLTTFTFMIFFTYIRHSVKYFDHV